MVIDYCRLAALLAAGWACAGCSCGLQNCKGPRCKSPYAGMKYDCCSETCGGWCAACGGPCSCGAQVNCGDACSGNGRCANGCGGGCNGGCPSPCDCGGRCPSCPCGGSLCGGCTLYRNESCKCGPLPHLRWLGGWLNCAGCGECYWNEWYNDPPACAEPCDCFGNWVGPGMSGNYGSPYRRHHPLWLATQQAKPSGGEPPTTAPTEQPPQSLAALDEAATTAQPAISQPPGVGAQPAVYDDATLSPELR